MWINFELEQIEENALLRPIMVIVSFNLCTFRANFVGTVSANHGISMVLRNCHCRWRERGFDVCMFWIWIRHVTLPFNWWSNGCGSTEILLPAIFFFRCEFSHFQHFWHLLSANIDEKIVINRQKITFPFFQSRALRAESSMWSTTTISVNFNSFFTLQKLLQSFSFKFLANFRSISRYPWHCHSSLVAILFKLA